MKRLHAGETMLEIQYMQRTPFGKKAMHAAADGLWCKDLAEHMEILAMDHEAVATACYANSGCMDAIIQSLCASWVHCVLHTCFACLHGTSQPDCCYCAGRQVSVFSAASALPA